MTSLLAGGLAAGFLKSWGMILVSEIGDKTFFIAAVMAMKNSRQSVSVDFVAVLLWHGVVAHSTKLQPSLLHSIWPVELIPHLFFIVQVFGGAAGALAAMTVLSALMGWAAPTLVSQLLPSCAADSCRHFHSH